MRAVFIKAAFFCATMRKATHQGGHGHGDAEEFLLWVGMIVRL
jgi:hypothetical protein